MPGSGKTSYAKRLNGVHIETDMFFIDEKCNYSFDKNKLREAHEWCRKEVEAFLKEGHLNVCVANTFSTKKELLPYIKYAEQYGYTVEIIRMHGEFKSVHDIPETVIQRMKERFQDIEGEKHVSRS